MYALTGYIATPMIKWVNSRSGFQMLDGKQILVFLPAWDGRYYVNYPEHEPERRMEEATDSNDLLKAHRLGMKIVLMLEVNHLLCAFKRK